MKTNPFLLTDYYKVGHPFQYPPKTTLVYSNLTPRKSRIADVNEMVFFGLQYFIKEYLIKYFNENFFDLPKETVIDNYKRRIVTSLGAHLPTYKHIEDLHDLGYLPIEIKALPEGSQVPMKVPCLTIVNTHPECYWLTNFFETILSTTIWQPCTSATIAHQYRKILDKFAEETGMPKEFVQWQGHDFSFRGMSSYESAVISGMGHLLSFTGTDSIPAIDALERYYNADAGKELIGGSVAATEHSVMCAGSKECEIDTFKRLITEVYPSGIVSIVSDTWDLWEIVKPGGTCDKLKKEILARNGKVVIRPDSGDPVDIICGEIEEVKKFSYMNEAEMYYRKVGLQGKKNVFQVDGKTYIVKYHSGPDFIAEPYVLTSKDQGVVELLWDVFGGTTTEKGYNLLDSHIGAIYGDSITPERAIQINQRLKNKGFASQVVFGIGSFSYQHITRDTMGLAMKATYVEVDGEAREIFKSPVTDDGTKISAAGLLKVYKDQDGKYALKDRVSWDEEKDSELKTVFKNGKLLKEYSLSEIRETLNKK